MTSWVSASHERCLKKGSLRCEFPCHLRFAERV
jgi:hypothetical protein